MKLLFPLIFALAMISSALAADCIWTYCAGKTIVGQSVCNEYGGGYRYTGNVRQSDCGWTAEQNECCRPTKGAECKWSNCMGIAYGPITSCKLSFDSSWVPNGETSTENCSWSLKRQKCCK